jgi:hypothetical protein
MLFLLAGLGCYVVSADVGNFAVNLKRLLQVALLFQLRADYSSLLITVLVTCVFPTVLQAEHWHSTISRSRAV